MGNLILELAGRNGQIALYDDRVVITRMGVLGFLTQGLKGAKDIPLSQITAIQLKECSKLTGGYLQFSIMGGVESKGGLLAAQTDENSVIFGSSDPRAIFGSKIANINTQWLTLKNEILQRLSSARSSSTGVSAMDELKKVNELFKQGVLTEAEFQAKKKQLLGL